MNVNGEATARGFHFPTLLIVSRAFMEHRCFWLGELCQEGFGNIAEVDHSARPVEVFPTQQMMRRVNFVRGVGLPYLGD